MLFDVVSDLSEILVVHNLNLLATGRCGHLKCMYACVDSRSFPVGLIDGVSYNHTPFTPTGSYKARCFLSLDATPFKMDIIGESGTSKERPGS